MTGQDSRLRHLLFDLLCGTAADDPLGQAVSMCAQMNPHLGAMVERMRTMG